MGKASNDVNKFTTEYIEEQYRRTIAGDRSSWTPDLNYGVLGNPKHNNHNNNSNKGGAKVAKATDGEE